MQSATVPRFLTTFLLVFLAFAVLWKGGKGLETLWPFLLLACAVSLFGYFRVVSVRGKQPVEQDVPVSLWMGFLAFFVWSIASYLTSETANYGLDEVLRDGALMLMFFWIIRQPIVKRDSIAQRLLSLLATLVFLASIMGVFVYVFQPVGRFVGTFVDPRFHTDYWPNAWAEFVLLAWPCLYVRALRQPNLKRTVMLGITFAALLLSYSRGSVIAFIAQLALLLGLHILPHLRKRSLAEHLRSVSRESGLLLTALCIAVIGFVGVNALRSHFYPVESVARKVTFTADEGISSLSERQQFFEQSWQLAWERPLTGWGPYSFRFVQPRFQKEALATSDHPHNIFLKAAMERGWLAAVLLFVLLAVILYRGARVTMRTIKESRAAEETLQLQAALLGVSGVLLHNLIDYNLQFVGIALPFWLLLGIIVVLVWPVERRSKALGRSMRLVETVVAICILIVAVNEGRFFVFETLGKRAEAQGDSRSALEWYDAAAGGRFSRDLHLIRAQAWLREGLIQEAQQALDVYQQQNMHDARAWTLKGDLLLGAGEGADAIHAYRQAIRRGGYNDLKPGVTLLRVLSEKQDYIQIMKLKETFDALFDAYGKAIRQNSHYIGLSKNVDHFRQMAPLLSSLFVAQKDHYELLLSDAEAASREAQVRYAGRKNGYLW